jgi:endonuclease/exonuclease/phosphatase family metal-dependent hydrolase
MLKDPDRDGTDELHSVVQRMPQAQRYTDWWDHAPADGVEQGATEHSSLDHMLVSTALFERLVSVRIDQTPAPMDYSDH